MRTTVVLDDDVVAAIERLRRDEGVGLSEALNRLARNGLRPLPERQPFVQQTSPMHEKLDVTNIGEVLELAEGADHR